MPTVIVTAQKEPEDKQKIPVSVTAVLKDTIENADIHIVSEAAIFAPNVFFNEASARKLSNRAFSCALVRARRTPASRRISMACRS